MKRIILAAALGLATLPAHAVVVHWTTSLDEIQAGQLQDPAPPTPRTDGTSNPEGNLAFPNSSGTGIGFGTYDTDTNVLTYDITVTGLGSVATLAHFHFGAPGVFRGPIRVERDTLGLGTLGGNTSGRFFGSERLDLVLDIINNTLLGADAAARVATAEGELLRGDWYINIHTQNFGSGEIRGQINIPEPASLAIFGLGLAGLAALRRRIA